MLIPGSVDRVTLRWGGSALNAGGLVLADGVPGPAGSGGAAYAIRDAAALAAYVQTAGQSYQKVLLNRHLIGGQPLRGIGIAPDSGLHTCMVALAGRDGELNRHVISPGNPVLGDLDQYDYAFVSIPDAVPAIVRSSAVVSWDSSPTPSNADVTTILDGFPLRLELYRGEIIPMRTHQRAPLHGHVLSDLTGVAEANVAVMYFCVDGRSKVQIRTRSATTGTPTVTMKVEAIFGYKRSAAPTLDGVEAVQLALDDLGNLTTTTYPTIIDFEGVPNLILRVTHTVTVASSKTAVIDTHLSAWD